MARTSQEIERAGAELEHVLAPVRGTRSVLYERNLGGLYLDIVPRAPALARYGMRVADVERTIEGAIGGLPIGTTVEGRNRFTISVRYPQDARGDADEIKRVLVLAPHPGSRRRRWPRCTSRSASSPTWRSPPGRR